MNQHKKPLLGVGVIVIRGETVLMGKRKGSHGEGTWSFPGGHLEFNEDVDDCARREVFEETGLVVDNIVKESFTNDIFDSEGKHYVTLFVSTTSNEGTAQVKEPDKCESWEWFAWDNLPEPLFIPIQNLLKQGYSPFE